MGTSPIEINLAILLILVPIQLAVVWGFLVLLNTRMGFDLKKVYEKIYTDPVASAILRGMLFFSVCYVVSQAFGRYV